MQDVYKRQEQQRDTDLMLALGEIFTLVVYGQLILENAVIYDVGTETVDRIFDFMVRDFSRFCLLYTSRHLVQSLSNIY